MIISEIHLRKLGFTCSSCRLFTKSKERIQKFEKQEIKYIYLSKQTTPSVFVIWFVDSLKIYLEKRLLIMHYL